MRARLSNLFAQQREFMYQRGGIMGHYGLEGVILAWKKGLLTTEQAIGQVLLLMQEFDRRLSRLEERNGPDTAARTEPRAPRPVR
jgi:hypothetical protein